MKTFLLVIGLLFSSVAFGTQLNISGDLTPAQKAQIELQAEQLAEQNNENPVTPNEILEWAQVGEGIGKGLAATAKELGVATNEFATTPVGIFALIIIGWHFLGDSIIGAIFGFSWLFFTIPTWIWMYRRTFLIKEIIFRDPANEASKGIKKEIKYQEYRGLMDGLRGCFWVTLMVIIAIGVLPIIF